MAVCLHCGELVNDGALFCTKCGYTLPQVDTTAGASSNPLNRAPLTPGSNTGTTPSGASPPPPPPPPPPGFPMSYVPGGYAMLSPPIPGSVGPIAPPPSGKYCIRCRTVISRVAVYCPVCQQPQS
ncbi:MAG TPA: zinc-ribbon domain-containing protein [Thermoplasmata archaeon]|nr:zinc-ribbon domain-containing protein [Thermoplasmata archaeon]